MLDIDVLRRRRRGSPRPLSGQQATGQECGTREGEREALSLVDDDGNFIREEIIFCRSERVLQRIHSFAHSLPKTEPLLVRRSDFHLDHNSRSFLILVRPGWKDIDFEQRDTARGCLLFCNKDRVFEQLFMASESPRRFVRYLRLYFTLALGWGRIRLCNHSFQYSAFPER